MKKAIVRERKAAFLWITRGKQAQKTFIYKTMATVLPTIAAKKQEKTAVQTLTVPE